jgi:hypothetical protein
MKTLLIRGTVLLSAVLYAGGTTAATKSISATATSRSVAQEPLAWFASGVGAVTTFTTTYDGAPGVSLVDSSQGLDGFGEELRPNASQPLLFEADYVNYNPTYGVVGYGYANLTLPAAGDGDANSIPDIFQFDKAATVSYTGIIHPDSPVGPNLITSGTLSKLANQTTVQNSFTSRDTTGNIQSFSGTILIGYFTGGGNYTRGTQGAANQLNLTLTGGIGSPDATYNATTTFTVVSADQVTIPAFTARRSDGFALNVLGVTLTRKGNKYIGDFAVSDGNLATFWQDYTRWVLELVDTNDADANGIPDFSDAIPDILPTVTISSPANNRSFAIGAAIVFQSNATDADGSVTRVDYFADSSPIGFSIIPPFSVNTTTLSSGAHTITAIATDNAGKTTTSTPINVVVAAEPTLSITRVNASTVTVTAGATANILHTLQSSTDAAAWTDVSSVMSGVRGGVSFPISLQPVNASSFESL